MKLFAFGLVVFVLGAMSAVGGLIGLSGMPAATTSAKDISGIPATTSHYESPPPNTPQPRSSVWEGPYRKDLGIRSDVYGSEWQGRELQAMVNANPNAQVYVLTAESPQGEHVEIKADMRPTASIYRKHWGPNGGPAKAESWTRDVRERIDNAASGKGFGGDVAVSTV